MNNIESIEIAKIHGHKNVVIDLSNNYSIFLSQNGQGKTTILKCIESALTQNIEKLQKLNFEFIKINFKNTDPLVLYKSDITNSWDSRAYKYLSDRLNQEQFTSIIEDILTLNSETQQDRTISKRSSIIAAKYGVAMGAVRDLADEHKELMKAMRSNEFFTGVKKFMNMNIIYLPTYRRIEDEFPKLEIDSLKNDSIMFGMSDVENKIDLIRREILATSNESMTRINGEILTRLVNGLKITDNDKSVITENNHQIELVLKRVGQTLSEIDKDRIINLVRTEEIFKGKKHDSLVYFLSQMINAFLEQKFNDDALSSFSRVCTEYFTNKKMIYDERELAIKVISMETGGEILLSQLSSGEKQIVSLFSRIYLDNSESNFILFDEPELSLSVEWQKRIINDLIDSKRVGSLIAMTHSPFIFKGLENYTFDLQRSFYKA